MDKPASKPHQGTGPYGLDEELIAQVSKQRQTELSELKSIIARKMYYAIEEKLAQEEQALKNILNWQQGKSSELSKYTLILDPHYFEQLFLN